MPRNGTLANSWYTFNASTTLDEEFIQVAEWLTDSKYNYDYVMMYYHEPDFTGHYAGPNSANITAVLKYIDEQFGKFIASLNKSGILNEVCNFEQFPSECHKCIVISFELSTISLECCHQPFREK